MGVFFEELVSDDAEDHDLGVVGIRNYTVIAIVGARMHRRRVAFDLNSLHGFTSEIASD